MKRARKTFTTSNARKKVKLATQAQEPDSEDEAKIEALGFALRHAAEIDDEGDDATDGGEKSEMDMDD